MKIGRYSYKWSAKNFFINMLMLFFVATVCLFCVTSGAGAHQNRNLQKITVNSGDTLWEIAQQIAPNTDPRQTVSEIKFLNNLEKSEVYLGQELLVEIR